MDHIRTQSLLAVDAHACVLYITHAFINRLHIDTVRIACIVC